MNTQVEEYLKEFIKVIEIIQKKQSLIDNIKDIIVTIYTCLKNGNKILIAGNGGSASDAQHFAAELVGRYKKERKAYSAISLTTDTSIITAWSNDYNFESVFSRQVEAHGKKDDIFIGISTSGNSKNIINAVKTAKKNKLKTICFLGKNGGELKKFSDISIIIPSDNTSRVQEMHTLLIHIICEEIEKKLL